MGEPSEVKLPPEIWSEVLARLPVKTLLRSRCVCKSWCSLIDNPNYISMHLILCENNNNPQKNQYLSLGHERLSNGGLSALELTTHCLDTMKNSGEILKFPRSKSFGVECHLNGLMLLLTWVDRNCHDLMLLNPSIRKYLPLPPCPAKLFGNRVLLGFDPSDCNDYKVVVLDCDQSRAVIYDLNKGSWRTKSIDYTETQRHRCGWRHVFSKGAGHWISYERDQLQSFDFCSEELGYRDLPSAPEKGRMIFLLGESVALYDVNNEGFCIWVMGEQYGGKQVWTKWYSGVRIFDTPLTAVNIFYVEKSGMLFTNTGTEVYSFHVRSDKVNSMNNIFAFACFMDTYVESLVLSSGLDIGGPNLDMPLCLHN